MAAIHGKLGSATFKTICSSAIELLSWSIDTSADIAETTDMGDTWKGYLAGFLDWTASLECNLPAGGIGTLTTFLGVAPDTLTINSGTLAGNAARKYYGNAICTGISPSGDKGEIAKVSIKFQGAGELLEGAAA